jgi:hypothetical protein
MVLSFDFYTGVQVKVLRMAARLSVRDAARVYGASVKLWKAWEADLEPIPADVIYMLEDAAEAEPLPLRFDD